LLQTEMPFAAQRKAFSILFTLDVLIKSAYCAEPLAGAPDGGLPAAPLAAPLALAPAPAAPAAGIVGKVGTTLMLVAVTVPLLFVPRTTTF
jgi:hypothetical protein